MHLALKLHNSLKHVVLVWHYNGHDVVDLGVLRNEDLTDGWRLSVDVFEVLGRDVVSVLELANTLDTVN